MPEKIKPIENGYGDALFQMSLGSGEYGMAIFAKGSGGEGGVVQVRVETTEQGYNIHLSTHEGGEVSGCIGTLEIETDKVFNKLTIKRN